MESASSSRSWFNRDQTLSPQKANTYNNKGQPQNGQLLPLSIGSENKKLNPFPLFKRAWLIDITVYLVGSAWRSNSMK